MHSDSSFFLMHRLTEVCGSSRKYQPEAASKQKASRIGIVPSINPQNQILLLNFSKVGMTEFAPLYSEKQFSNFNENSVIRLNVTYNSKLTNHFNY